MQQKAINLLTEDDLIEIEVAGPTRYPGDGLVMEAAGGLIFTVKGAQYFRHAFAFHGWAVRWMEFKSKEALIAACEELREHIRTVVRAQLAEDLRAGRIPAKDREIVEAKLSGDLAEVFKAMRRRIELDFAGDNIIPVRFA